MPQEGHLIDGFTINGQRHRAPEVEILEQLTILLRGALAEMRTMLIELRPQSLKNRTLGELIQTLVEANQAKIDCPVTTVVDNDMLLPEDVTIVFYRVAQEAINNIIKYAEATEISIHVDSNNDGVVMTIYDNGRGFLPVNVPVGHFGLDIMSERMQDIGGVLTIDSEPDHGTLIAANWLSQKGDVNNE